MALECSAAGVSQWDADGKPPRYLSSTHLSARVGGLNPRWNQVNFTVPQDHCTRGLGLLGLQALRCARRAASQHRYLTTCAGGGGLPQPALESGAARSFRDYRETFLRFGTVCAGRWRRGGQLAVRQGHGAHRRRVPGLRRLHHTCEQRPPFSCTSSATKWA